MMTIDENFYFEKRITKISYTDNPESEDVDLPRLIAGEKAFLETIRTSQLQPKKLILAELDLKNWPSDFQRFAFKLRLEQLARESFQFYSGRGEEINLNDCKFSDFIEIINKPGTKQDLALKLNLPIDQLFMFDNAFAYQFAQGFPEDCKPLLGKTNITLTTPMSSATLNDFVKQNGQDIATLDLSCYFNLQQALSNNLFFPALNTILFDEYRYISAEDLREKYSPRLYAADFIYSNIKALMKMSPELSKLNIKGSSRHMSALIEALPHPEKITELDMPSLQIQDKNIDNLLKMKNLVRVRAESIDCAPTYFNQFLNQILTPSLQFLALSGCVFSSETTLPQHLDLSALTELTLNQIQAPIHFLEHLLQKAPRLKKLTLCAGSFEDGHLSDLDLSELEELDLSNTKLSEQALGALLRAAPRLKKIMLLNSSISNPEYLNDIHLSQLEEITFGQRKPFLQGGLLNAEALGKILKNAVHLKLLDLTGCQLQGEIEEHLYLPALESVHLELAICDAQPVGKILEGTSNLKKLDLKESTIGGNIAETLNLSQLEELGLHQTSLKWQALNKILHNASRLKALDLQALRYNSDSNFHLFEDLNLLQLEELTISNWITPDILVELFANARALKKIKGPRRILPNTALESLDSSQLEAMEDIRCSLSASIRTSQKARKLKKLDLSNHTIVQGDEFDNIDLSHIETLCLRQSVTTVGVFVKILKLIPYLKELDLQGFTLNDDFTGVLGTVELSHVKRIELSYTTISDTLLYAILQNTPNLEHLNLTTTKISFSSKQAHLNLTQLKYLHIWNTDIHPKTLGHMLQHASSIVALRLRHQSIDVDSTETFDLLQLRTLSIDASPIDLRTLGKVLQNAPELTSLRLSDCMHLHTDEIQDLDLSKLIECRIGSSHISVAAIGKILENAQQLEVLSINDCATDDGKLPYYLNLPALKEIDIQGTRLPLGDILKGTSRLTKLTLKYVMLEALSDDICLPNLQKIEIVSCTFTAQALCKLLQSISPLQHIDLRGIEIKDPYNLPYYIEKYALSEQQRNILSPWLGSSKTPAAPQKNPRTTQTVDADTQWTPKTYHIKRQFLGKPNPPSPRDLRLNLFHNFTLNANSVGGKAPFILEPLEMDVTRLKPITAFQCPYSLYEEYKNSKEDSYFFRDELTLTDQWQTLPSLFANEKIESYFVNSKVPVEVKYDAALGLHFIRLKEGPPETVMFEMLLSNQLSLSYDHLPEGIRKLINDCYGFKDLELTIDKHASAQDYLNALIIERKGACRHRAVVFKHLMSEQFPEVPVRIVSNDCHMYVEVQYQGTWIKCDLGGYTAHLDINDNLMPADAISQSDTLDKPQEAHELILSHEGKQIPKEYIDSARNLTKLTLKKSHPLPPQNMSGLDTLVLEEYQLTADILHHMLTRLPHLKTLKLLNCLMSVEEFQKIDLSAFKQLEYVHLQGDFIPSNQALTKLMATTPKNTEWVIEGTIPEDIPEEAHEESKHEGVVESKEEIPHITPANIKPASQALPERLLNAKIRTIPIKPVKHRYFLRSEKKLHLEQQILHWVQDKQNKSVLIDTDNVEALRLALEKDALGLQRSCYYINSPEELRIARAYLKRNGTEGQLIKEKGGALYDFLTATHAQPPLLIINFNNFKADDIVRCNTILDDDPLLDGVPLNHCKVIGLYNRAHPNAYQGVDFSSRFDAQETLRNQLAALPPLTLTPPERLPAEDKLCVIEFSGDLDWEKKVTGKWVLKEQWCFEEGPLLKAIREGKTNFVFNNAPLDNPEFQHFMHDLQLHQGIYHRGELYENLPTSSQIFFTNHAPAFRETFARNNDPILPATCYLLNAAHFNQMSVTSTVHAEKLVFSDGLIKQYAGKVLSVYLTSSLASDVWLKLHQLCKEHKTTLSISCAPGVHISTNILPEETTPAVLLPETAHTQISIHEPPTYDANTVIIDISEVSAAELLSSPKAKLNIDTGQIECSVIPQYLKNTLASGKTVVLKGSWSEAQALAMHPLLFERAQNPESKGQLLIVTEAPQLFSILNANVSPTAQIKAAPHKIHEKAAYEARLEKVESILIKQEQPTVMLTGATGVGKTYFIKEVWEKEHPACHYGEDKILTWLQDKRPGIKTLFIDEANMTEKQWTMFNGLYQDPRGIFYQGQYYDDLTSEHKVIFAGNPVSYGGERESSAFFAAHDNEVHFDPIPTQLIESNLGLNEGLTQSISSKVNYMMRLDPNDTLITPREILMIANLTKAFIKQHPTVSEKDVVEHFSYEICKQHIPPTYLTTFIQKFKPKVPLAYPSIQLPQFLINPRNEGAIHALYSHLQLRQLRLAKTEGIPAYGGLGGLIIEGNPGIGKSALVKQLFAAQGLKENEEFICLPVKLSPDEKERRLLAAFHAGQIVIIDELNSSPMLERLMNALLEGHDLEGNKPKKPGFMVVATQNPITFSGRIQTTLPLKHRLQTIKMPDYTEDDMLAILKHMKIPSAIAQSMLGEMKRDKALCFRDVQKAAKRWIENPIHQKVIKVALEPVAQVGFTCKSVAIANVEKYYAEKMGYQAIPLHSNHNDQPSIRKLVKDNGSVQGEILEFNQWQKNLTDLGFETKSVDFTDDFNLFLESIAKSLAEGHLPLIAFAVQRREISPHPGLPDVDPTEPQEAEHAAVITGYNPSTDQLTIQHWGSTYTTSATNLFHSSMALTKTRNEEYYQKNPQVAALEKAKKYLPVKPTTQSHASSILKTAIPAPESGFKAKLLIVKDPVNKEAFLQRRQSNLSKKHKLAKYYETYKQENSERKSNQDEISQDKRQKL